MSSQWYYSKNGQRQGPVDSEELKKLTATGQLQATDLIWKEGMGQWTEAKKVKGLFPAQGTTAPQSPPPIPSACNIPPIPAAGTAAQPSLSNKPAAGSSAKSITAPVAAAAARIFKILLFSVLGFVALMAITIGVAVIFGNSRDGDHSSKVSSQSNSGTGDRTATEATTVTGNVSDDQTLSKQKEFLRTIPFQISSSMDGGKYERILDAVKRRDPESLAHELVHTDASSVFSKDEIAAINAPNTRTQQGTRFTLAENGDHAHVGKFYLGGTDKDEYKLLWFDSAVSPPEKLQRIEFVFPGENDKIETTLDIFENRVCTVKCETAGRFEETSGPKLAVGAKNPDTGLPTVYQKWEKSFRRVDSHAFYEIEFEELGKTGRYEITSH